MSAPGPTEVLPDEAMALLRYVVRTPLHIKVPPAKRGGMLIPRGPDGEAAQLTVAEDLVERGLLEGAATDIGPGRRFSITDDGRRAARGDAELGEDDARAMHIGDLTTVWADHDVAKRHVDLRVQAAVTVRAALSALGHEYHATHGWHITAMVTPDGRLGFVNTATGTAVDTDVRLGDDVVTAVTIPDQADGPLASGAVAWAGVDLGESRNASSPAGWRQLLVDVRTDRSAQPQPTTMTWAAVTWWCLATCYSSGLARYGRPGIACLDDHPGARAPIDDWPMSHEQRERMHAVALRWLRRIATDVAGGCDQQTATLVAGDRSADEIMQALHREPRGHAEIYSLESNLAMLTSQYAASGGVIAEALTEAEIPAIIDVCRGLHRWQDVIAELLSRALHTALLPVATVAATQLRTVNGPEREQLASAHPDRAVDRQACDGLKGMASVFANRLLAHARSTGHDTLLELYAAYGDGQPVNVRVELTVGSTQDVIRRRVEGRLREIAERSSDDHWPVDAAVRYLAEKHVVAVVGTHPRDTAIVAAADAGRSTRHIAALAGVSHQRVSQIARAAASGSAPVG